MWSHRQVHVVIHLSKPIAYATPRVNPDVNCGSWVIMTYVWRLIFGNKCPTLVGSHAYAVARGFMGISILSQSCLTPLSPTDCSLPGSSVHGILQARILEWVAISFFRGSSKPTDWTRVFCISGIFCTFWAIREALSTPFCCEPKTVLKKKCLLKKQKRPQQKMFKEEQVFGQES